MSAGPLNTPTDAAPAPAEPAGDSTPSRLAGMLRAFRHRNYRLFFGGQVISLVGTFLTQVATVWLIYHLTNNAWLLGVVGFAGQIPMFAVAPFAGVWVDRWNRQRLIVVTQTLAMLQSFALAALTFRYAHNPAVAVPGIIALSLVQGLINAFDMPGRQAFLVEMVTDRNDLSNAIALNSTMVHGARLVGPAVAGFLIYYVGAGWCFLLDGFSYIAVIISLLRMTVELRPHRPKGSIWEQLREGFQYVWSFAPIRVLLLVMAILSLTGMPAFSVLMPVFAKFYGGEGRDSQLLGILMGCSGLGSLAGAFYLASRRTVVGLGRVIVVCAAAFGLSLIAFSFVRHLWLALLIVPVAGCAAIVNFASANTVLQTLTDEDKRGRVMSFFSMAFVGMTPFGNLVAGALAQHLRGRVSGPAADVPGAAHTIFLAGLACVAAAGVFASRLPALRKIVRPIYVQKGIIPTEVAHGMESGTEVVAAGVETT
jgi:MFS family permease